MHGLNERFFFKFYAPINNYIIGVHLKKNASVLMMCRYIIRGLGISGFYFNFIVTLIFIDLLTYSSIQCGL